MIQRQRSSAIKMLVIMALSAIIMGGIYYYHAASQGPITDYQEWRDKEDILNLFEAERYWLTATDDYDPVFTLDNLAPNKHEARYYGALKIKVLREDNQFIGFGSYYRKSLSDGFILFMCIKPEFRGKRYAEQLMRYAENDLKHMGVSMIRLLTRTSNHKAQALYNRLGYTVYERDDVGGFVYYFKMI